MPTLILSARYSPDSVALWKAALALGWDVERLQTWRPDAGLGDREPVIYGEPMFAAAVAEALGLALLEPPLDWLVRVPETYRRRVVGYLTLGEVRAITGPTFLKPADDKCFPAQVYASGAALLAETDLPPDIPILVSEPVVWEVEWRCFVRDGGVVTLSPYWRDGGTAQADDGGWPSPPDEREAAGAFAAAVLADPAVPRPPAFVLDVGRVAGRGWAVVEANPVFGSGVYGCDPVPVLSALQRGCRRREDLTDADRPWAGVR